jgi:hypothetical protein
MQEQFLVERHIDESAIPAEAISPCLADKTLIPNQT